VSLADSQNDNSDNSTQVADSYNQHNSVMSTSTASSSNGGASNSNMFGNGALVASATLSSYVIGVSVTFEGSRDTGAGTDNSLSNSGGAFQNFAGMQALNQNTGVGASQSASVSVAVTTGDVSF
jgi:hypothetical protein